MDGSIEICLPTKNLDFAGSSLVGLFLIVGVVVIVQGRCPYRMMQVVVEVESLVEVLQLLEFAARSLLLLLVDIHHSLTKQLLLLLFARWGEIKEERNEKERGSPSVAAVQSLRSSPKSIKIELKEKRREERSDGRSRESSSSGFRWNILRREDGCATDLWERKKRMNNLRVMDLNG